MTTPAIYPRTYEYGPLKKTLLGLFYLGLAGLGLVNVALSRGLLWLPARAATLVGLGVLLATSFSTIYLFLAPRAGLWIKIAFALAVCGLWYALVSLGNVFVQFPPNFWAAQAAGLMLCGVCLYFLAGALRGRLILHAGLLDYRTAFGSLTVRYDDIVDIAQPSTTSDQHLLTLKLRGGTSFAIGVFGRADDIFVAWVYSLPDSKHAALERQWADWQAHPAWPRIYRQGTAWKTALSLLSLAICALGFVCIAVGMGRLPEMQRACDLAMVFILAPAVVVMIDPRCGPWTKTILLVADFGLFCAYIPVLDAHMPSNAATPFYLVWVLPAIGLGLVGQGLLFLVATLRSRLVLYADRLGYRSLMTTRTLFYADIAQTFKHAASPFFSISLELKSGRPLRIVNFGRSDTVFLDWINGFPNKETEDAYTARERLLADSALGANPTERMTAFRRDVRRLKTLAWIARIAALWGYLLPYPFTVCMSILMALPVVALLMVMTSRSRWSMHSDTGSYPLSIGAEMALLPAIVLALRMFADSQVFDWIAPAAWSVAAALGLMLGVCLVERRIKWSALASGCIIYLCYAWGSLTFLNTALDNSPRESVPVKVVQFEKGDKYSSMNVMRLDAGPHDKAIYVPLPKHTARVGDVACLIVHRGALGWPWYYDAPCPKAQPPHPAR